MGCIEILLSNPYTAAFSWINRNMGCIEIASKIAVYLPNYRLIETWDVLK